MNPEQPAVRRMTQAPGGRCAVVQILCLVYPTDVGLKGKSDTDDRRLSKSGGTRGRRRGVLLQGPGPRDRPRSTAVAGDASAATATTILDDHRSER